MLTYRMSRKRVLTTNGEYFTWIHYANDLSVPFPTKGEAEIAYGSLSVDQEPKRGGVKKSMTVNGNCLQVHFEASEARKMRVAINSFFDHLNLVVQTIEKFGPPRTDTYSY